MNEQRRRSRLQRVVWACRYTWVGLCHALRYERAFQEEVAVFVALVLPGAWLLARSGVEAALLIGSWVVVMIVELLNTSVERVVDRIGLEHHELSGHAKDLGSAAVGISIALAVLVWALVLAGH